MSRTITVSDIRKLIDRAIAEGDPSVDTLSRDSDVGKRFIANLINAQGEGSVGAQAGGGPGQARHGEHDPATSGAAGGEGEAARDDNDEESGPLPSTADELLWLWILVRAACGKFAATMRASRAAAGAAEASSPRHPPPNISEKPSIIIIFIRFSLDDQFKTTADANGFGIFIARIISVLGATWKLFDRYKHGRKREPTWIYVSFRVGSSLARFTMDANGNIVHEVWHEDAKFFGDAFRIVFWGDDAFSDDIEALLWLVRRTSADFLLVSGNRDAAEYKIFTAQQFLAILTGDDTTPKAMAVINDIKRGAISRNLKSLANIIMPGLGGRRMDFTIAADLKPAVGWEEENAPTIDLGLPRPHPKGNDYKKGQYLTAWFKIATEGVEGGDVEGSSEMET